MAAVPAGLRAQVEAVLADPRRGGRGLRAWLALMEAEHRPLPAALPAELVEVYLRDGEALPAEGGATDAQLDPARLPAGF